MLAVLVYAYNPSLRQENCKRFQARLGYKNYDVLRCIHLSFHVIYNLFQGLFSSSKSSHILLLKAYIPHRRILNILCRGSSLKDMEHNHPLKCAALGVHLKCEEKGELCNFAVKKHGKHPSYVIKVNLPVATHVFKHTNILT